MCGIFGVFTKNNFDFNIKLLIDNALDNQNHRGPDSRGYWISKKNNVALAHNRLSILDLSDNGNQPFFSIDGRYCLIFNGEIYNYIEIKYYLISKGVVFISDSDTEVLLESYKYWGSNIFEKIIGTYSFAIYDLEQNSLFCARDPIGEKPFLYYFDNKAFYFSSELDTLKKIPGIKLEVNYDSITSILVHNLRHIPDPYTAYKGIMRLKPGHAMELRDGKLIRIWNHWIPKKTNKIISADGLLEEISNAVKFQIRADVKIGVFLSGGLDSSGIVSLINKLSNNEINTYSYGINKYDSDLIISRSLAKEIGSNHKEYYFDINSHLNNYIKLLRKFGEPIMILPMLYTYLLSLEAKKDNVKVVLSGNGADELFFGYDGSYKNLLFSNFFNSKLNFLKSFKDSHLLISNNIDLNVGHIKYSLYHYYSDKMIKEFITKDVNIKNMKIWIDEFKYWGKLSNSQNYIEESNFLGLLIENQHSLTTSTDFGGMLASIEIRNPFLDKNVISYAMAIKNELKVQRSNFNIINKYILREAFKKILPNYIINAPKRGFGHGISENTLLKTSWYNYAEELLMNPCTINGFFDKVSIQKLWYNFKKYNTNTSSVMKHISIQTWLRD